MTHWWLVNHEIPPRRLHYLPAAPPRWFSFATASPSGLRTGYPSGPASSGFISQRLGKLIDSLALTAICAEEHLQADHPPKKLEIHVPYIISLSILHQVVQRCLILSNLGTSSSSIHRVF